LVDLAAGLAASFFVVVAFFAGAFLAAARAFVVAEVPVTDWDRRISDELPSDDVNIPS
jgi:hypothetical protein